MNLKSAALGLLRRGQRQVSWVPDWMGWGNNAYQWLWAYQGAATGHDRRALLPTRHGEWGRLFPMARQHLLLERSEVRFRDQRVTPWHDEDRERMLVLLDEFIQEMLLPGADFQAGDPGELVVNVRRGDYYSNPAFRAEFGIRLEPYLDAALSSITGDSPTRVHIVSDDVEWCSRNLAWIKDLAPLTFEDPNSRTPMSDLRRVAGARRLVITNSTFSYWASYIGDTLHGDEHQVVAPSVFRYADGQPVRSHLLRPNWTVIDDIPGGWSLGANDAT